MSSTHFSETVVKEVQDIHLLEVGVCVPEIIVARAEYKIADTLNAQQAYLESISQ